MSEILNGMFLCSCAFDLPNVFMICNYELSFSFHTTFDYNTAIF